MKRLCGLYKARCFSRKHSPRYLHLQEDIFKNPDKYKLVSHTPAFFRNPDLHLFRVFAYDQNAALQSEQQLPARLPTTHMPALACDRFLLGLPKRHVSFRHDHTKQFKAAGLEICLMPADPGCLLPCCHRQAVLRQLSAGRWNVSDG